MADVDHEMGSTESPIPHRPPPASDGRVKHRAVPGVDRLKIDEMIEDINYYRSRLGEEAKRRKELEKTATTLEQMVKTARQDAADGAQIELNRYVADFEVASRKHYEAETAKTLSDLRASQHTVSQLEDSLAKATEFLRAQEAQIATIQQQSTVQEEAEQSRYAELQHQTAAQEEAERRLTEAEATLVTQKVAYEKAIAEKSNEIMALMARLQSPQGSAAAVPENFPATPPPLIPRFASRSRRKDRAVQQVFRSSGNRVPTLPLQLAPSPQLEQLNALDPTDDDSVTRITDIVQQVLAGMGIVQVTVQEESKKKKKHGPSKMAAAVKKQQAELAPEQDQIYKNGLRELWRVTNGIDTANGFKNYTPADSKRVEICNDGGDGPDPSDYSLDFGDGYASSLWNKAVIGKLVKGFQRARAASGGWGLPEVSDTYLEGELYGQLKRSQQAWALWRPRLLPALLEWKPRPRQSKGLKDTWAGVNHQPPTSPVVELIETVKKIVLMKSHKGDPDLATWKFFKTMLEYLDVAGMSEEDSEVRILCEKPVNTFTVRLCAWRAPPIADYLRLIDETGQTLKKTNAAPRIRDGGAGTSPAPEGLPRKMYDEAWLSNQPASYIEDLNISAEVFEFLVAATSSIHPALRFSRVRLDQHKVQQLESTYKACDYVANISVRKAPIAIIIPHILRGLRRGSGEKRRLTRLGSTRAYTPALKVPTFPSLESPTAEVNLSQNHGTHLQTTVQRLSFVLDLQLLDHFTGMATATKLTKHAGWKTADAVQRIEVGVLMVEVLLLGPQLVARYPARIFRCLPGRRAPTALHCLRSFRLQLGAYYVQWPCRARGPRPGTPRIICVAGVTFLDVTDAEGENDAHPDSRRPRPPVVAFAFVPAGGGGGGGEGREEGQTKER
ncbi:hypothetical protein DFH07DRAFT_960667 [Mycena maculata]|uniref:Uncharacterized protein n=1 Tax=Mycena maculata TaxID=230809 RepID=A0AAD7N9B9_9AGAR|nr:hypothetical protein DFH07DRAFT_960667 [Mycena maculata]